MKLNLDKQESEFLNKAVTHWEKEHLIDNELAENLRNSYEVKGFDWMRLAKYSFWIALFCGAIAVGSLIINDTFLNWLKNLYYTPDIVISILSGILAAVSFFFGRRWERKYPEKIFSNEATIFTGVLFTASPHCALGKALDNGGLGHFSLLFLLSVFVYAVLAWRDGFKAHLAVCASFAGQLVWHRNRLSNPVELLFFVIKIIPCALCCFSILYY